MKSHGVYWNNAEARTGNSIILLKVMLLSLLLTLH